MFQKKNSYYKFYILLLISAFMMGCDLSESDADSSGGSFSYPGGSGTFDGGELEDDGLGGTIDQYNLYSLYLHSDGLAFNTTTSQYSGAGDVLIITLITDSVIVPGNYTYDSTDPASQTNSMVFDSAELLINYNTGTGNADSSFTVTGGTLTVTSGSPDYVLSFELTTASGSVTGDYEGHIQYFSD